MYLLILKLKSLRLAVSKKSRNARLTFNSFGKTCQLLAIIYMSSVVFFRMATELANKKAEREALRGVIQQWNANRLDLFELSEPNEVRVANDTSD